MQCVPVVHGALAEHAVHAPHGLHGLRVLHALHALHARTYSQVTALPGLERIKNPPRRSDIEAIVRPAESSSTAAIARSRHVAVPESNQEADSSQRDCRGDRTETPGMPTGSRPEIRGIRRFRCGQHGLFSSRERPYPASSYPGHHFEAGGNGLPSQKLSDAAPRKQVDR